MINTFVCYNTNSISHHVSLLILRTPIKAAIGGKIIARESIKGFKKDVLTKIHGGGARDRKRKLLEKQKKGKARSKQFGRVEIPQEAFIGVLKISKEK